MMMTFFRFLQIQMEMEKLMIVFMIRLVKVNESVYIAKSS